MTDSDDWTDTKALFRSERWAQTLAQYSAVTNLTVQVYADHGRGIGGPGPPTPLFELFTGQGRTLRLFEQSAARARQAPGGPIVMIHDDHGLATVSAPLRSGHAAAIAIAGFALVQHLDESLTQALADEHGLPFQLVWDVVRREPPVARQRLILCANLLSTLGDALLREEARARQLTETSAELADALRLKDEFLSVLSHELRTPLAPILSWTQILKRDPDPRRLPRALDVIERNVRHQITLVDELLDLNRIQRQTLSLERRPRDLREIVRAAVDKVADAVRQQGLEIERRDGDVPVLVEADVERLAQVFDCVLSNAIKFTPAGGRISVETGTRADRAVVTVCDTGLGVAPQFLPFVFDVFRQQEEGVQRRYSGLGVGLALARRLVELHGGTIDAASPGPGLGTEVTIRLPVITAEGDAPRPGQDELKAAPRFDGLEVLLVEDSEDTGAATREMLEHLGARVIVAANGQEALRILDSVAPDVMITDLRMPVMDGFELIASLRRRSPAVALPVVACSGLVAREDQREARKAGFDAYLSKPFDFEVLASTLESVTKRNAAGDNSRPPTR